jgi:hypothetical protein
MQLPTENHGYSLHVLQLLDKVDINPESLSDPMLRTIIEKNIINQEIINADDMAILQLLSQAEIDSDTSEVNQERLVLLKTRIQEGPLRSLIILLHLPFLLCTWYHFPSHVL